jgi:hypothetical protein
MQRSMDSSLTNDTGILPRIDRHPERLPRPVAPATKCGPAPASSSELPLTVLSERAWIEAFGY